MNKFKDENIDWIYQQIVNLKGLVRTKTTKEKSINYLERIDNFSFNINDQSINKKELTKIKNDLDKICSLYYSLFNMDDKEQSNDIQKLYNKRNLKEFYGDDDDINYQTVRKLQFISTYAMSSITYSLNAMKKFNFNELEKDFIEKYYPNMDKWDELNKKIIELNSFFNPTKEEKEKRKLKEIKGKINPKLKVKIDKIAEDFRQIIEKNEYDYLIKLSNRFRLTFGESVSRSKKLDKKDDNLLYSLSRYTNYNKKNGLIQLSNDYDTLMKNDAKETSENVIISWQLKMYDKLGGDFFDSMVDFKTDVIGKGYLSNEIDFNFDDGSRFTLRNQIVHKVSNRGTFFYTFPTTFHNAILPNGEIVKNPNEYNVKNEFKNYYEKL